MSVDAATNRYTVSYGSTSHSVAVKAATTPAPTTASVVLESLLPNPAGDDEQLEELSLKNKGTGTVSLMG